MTNQPAAIQRDAQQASSEGTSLWAPEAEDATFQSSEVATVAAGHFVHDVYSAFLAPLLVAIQNNLGLTYTLAGSLVIYTQIASLLNPLMGYLADRVSVRYFVIMAPAVTATLFSSVGLADSYVAMALILFTAGISIAAFHAPAPAMIGQLSGGRTGTGMSVFMAAGELARTVGPLVVIAGISWFGLEGIWRLSAVGWLASLFLFIRLRRISPAPRAERASSLDHFWLGARKVFPALSWLLLARIFMLAALTTYLPIYMSDERASSLWLAAAALSLLEAAGVVGALTAGTLSDRFGRQRVLLALVGLAPVGFIAFLYSPEWLALPLLLLLGFLAISPQPVILAYVQDQFPANRALANGTYLGLSFLIHSLGIWALGTMADRYGLSRAFLLAALTALLAVPAIFALPRRRLAVA